MPTLKIPKFGFSVDTDGDKTLKHEASDAETTVKITTDGSDSKDYKNEHTGSKFSFGISKTKVKGPEVDLTLSKKDTDLESQEGKVETIASDNVPVDAKQKGSSWFPQFFFSKPAVNVAHESDADTKLDLSKEATAEGKVVEDSPAAEPEMKAKFSLPKFSFSKTSAKETFSENTVALEVSLAEGEVKVKETKDVPTGAKSAEDETKSKETGGSPLKFKMPVFKMPKIGMAATVNEDSNNKETEEMMQITKEGGEVVIKTEALSTEVKTEDKDEIKASTPDPETSPSKFRLPLFKMPKLNFSRQVPEEENTSDDSKLNKDPEMVSKEEGNSPMKVLASIGEMLKNIDVELDIPSPLDENIESPTTKQEEEKLQETVKKDETTKSPEKTSWFKFPTFGLSSPTKIAKEEKKSPADLTGDDELSLTCSIPSSEAFADISSAMTSENVGFSLSSPTKVTVKYSDPDSAALARESHSSVVMSTTKREVFSVEPNLPEKVTILSSGVSSSSEDTVKLESGKIHIISSNIQATPDPEQAKVLTSIHVTDSRSSKSTYTESRVVRESSSQEVVFTKQITRVVKTTEPISDETATSIKQLKDSVHTDKMKFFDEAEK